MPLIHVKSLPFHPPLEMGTLVENLARDFAQETGIGLEHVTVTWEFLMPGHYAVAGKSASHQPQDSHPVMVELLAPDLNSAETVEKMLRAIASGISKHTRLPYENIFIHHQQAHAGRVFDAGKIVRW